MTTRERAKEKGAPRWALAGFVLVISAAAMTFIFKMMEFAMTLTDPDSGGFGGFGAIAIGAYLTGMLPIAFITLWGVFSGQYRDIEGPKHRMLELDAELEREAARTSYQLESLDPSTLRGS